jgi:hypothetical protein
VTVTAAYQINPDVGRPSNGAVYRYISGALLNFDPLVNREVDLAWVADLARRYDPANVGTLVVSARSDGNHVVIDGQHRVLAARDALQADAEFHCDLRYGLTVAQEAALFLELNKRRAVSPIDKFRKHVIAEHEPEVSIDKVLENLGIGMQRHVGPRAVGGPRAVTAIHRKGGDALLALTLSLALEAWPNDSDGLCEEILRGLGEVLHRHGDEIEVTGFAHRLKTSKTAGGLRGQAQTAKGMHGGNLWTHVADTLVSVYNYRRQNKLPRWS